MSDSKHGVILHDTGRGTDYLYRISLKCVIKNEKGEVLVVKEMGRDYWDLPGGGIDHDEDIKTSITRELDEEVGLTGDFTYRTIYTEEPFYNDAHGFWQMRIIFEVIPENMSFHTGEDTDYVEFIDPSKLERSDSATERKVSQYARLV